MSVVRSTRCPCCTGDETIWVGKLPDSKVFAGKPLPQPLAGGALYHCCNCKLKFRYPVQDIANYRRLYDNEATSVWPSNTVRPDLDLVAKYIFEQRPQGGDVLDFGCYSGGLLARLGSTYRRYGVEINQAAASVASRTIRNCVWSSIEDIPRALRFDVVIASDVIEHIPDPLNVIAKLAGLMKDQGILIVTTGDAENYLWDRFGANWWYCFYPEHITFLSQAWFNYYCKITGMTIVRCDTFMYCNLGLVRRFIDLMFTYCYGWFPDAYLRVGGFLKKMLGRPALVSIPGNGVSRDHLFIVLEK